MNAKIIFSTVFLVLLVNACYAKAFLYKRELVGQYSKVVNVEPSVLKKNLAFNEIANSNKLAAKDDSDNKPEQSAVNSSNQANDLNSANSSNANKDNNAKEELKTILDNNAVNNIDDFSKSELLKKEVQKLNQELDNLNTKVDVLEKENTKLKIDLQKYGNEEKRKLQKTEQVEALSEEARSAKANMGDRSVPDSYISAQNLLIIGNTNLAEQQFKAFITNASGDKKSNEYLGSTSAAGLFIAYANYWLGKINNINGDYRQAAEYFSESYKITNYSNLSLMSLVGLTESLTRLSKDTEACTAIRQFQQDYSKAAGSKNFSFDARYLKVVDNFKAINRCQ